MRLTQFFGTSLLVLVVSVAATSSADDDSRSARARQQLSQLHDRMESVRREIKQDTDKQGDLSDTLSETQARISKTNKRLEKLDKEVSKHKDRLAVLENQRNSERDSLKEDLDALRQQVRSAYQTGRINRMRLLLSGSSPERIGRMLNYYQYIAKAQSQKVGRLKKAVSELASKQRSLKQERQKLADQRADRATTLDSLQASQAKQKATLEALDKRLGSHRSSLSDMREQEQRLKKLLGSVQENLSDLSDQNADTQFPNLRGDMKPPVPADRVLAAFGQTKSGSSLRWQGEWLAAERGTPVHAVAGGRVVHVGYIKGYGLIIIIDHGQNYYTVYGHADSSYVDTGDSISTGQTIATAGHSGGHANNGIYFEIRRGQTPVNPSQWISS